MPTRNVQDLPKAGKIAALDVGEKTIGLAISDVTRLIAQPKTTIANEKWQTVSEQLKQLIADEQITCFVVGLPLHMSGEMSPSADRAMSLASQLEQDLGLTVLLWDERLSTKAAESALFEQRTGRQKRASKKSIKKQLDNVAASLILQGVLEMLRY